MADYKDSPLGRQDPVYTHDEGDGSFSRSVAPHLRGWDSTDGAWYRLPVDHATGALKVNATLAAGSVDIGIVDQGAPGSSAWPVSLASVPSHNVTNAGVFAVQASWASAQHVIVDTAPTTAVTGTVTANAGTNLNTSALALDATLTGGAAKTQLFSASKGSNPTIAVTAEAINANINALHVIVENASVPVSGTVAVTQATASSLNATVVGVDTALGATVTPKAASTWDVSDRPGRALGSIANTSFAVTNAGTFAVQAASTQSGSWVLSGSDNVSTLPVSARVHNGFTNLYVRDPGVIAVLSELLFEVQQLNFTQEN